MDLVSMLERDEGRCYIAYPDPLTRSEPWTIGVGHTGPEVHGGLVWNDEQIDAARDADIDEATEGCRENFPWFDALNEPRQAVLVSMAFQMGIHRLLGFVNTLKAIGDGKYGAAADGMRSSVWAHQTPLRAIRLAEQMETGEWV